MSCVRTTLCYRIAGQFTFPYYNIASSLLVFEFESSRFIASFQDDAWDEAGRASERLQRPNVCTNSGRLIGRAEHRDVSWTLS